MTTETGWRSDELLSAWLAVTAAISGDAMSADLTDKAKAWDAIAVKNAKIEYLRDMLGRLYRHYQNNVTIDAEDYLLTMEIGEFLWPRGDKQPKAEEK